jgi:PAS domain S-box-containing protein
MNQTTRVPDYPSRLETELELLREENTRLSLALQQSENLVTLSPAFFSFISCSGLVTELNDLSLQVIGASREEIVGKLFWECPWWKPLPDSAARIRALLAQGAEGQVQQLDIEYCAKAGAHFQKRWVAITVTPIRDKSGTVLRMGVSGIDVTDRIVAQTALRHSQEQLSRAVAVSKVGFYDWDLVSDSVTFSDQMKKDWAIPEGGLNFQQCVDRIHPEDRQRIRRLILVTMANHQPYRAEYRVFRPDGTMIWIEAQGEVLRDENHRPIRFFGTSIDITERKTIEARLFEEKHKFESIFVDSAAAMALLRGPTFIFEKVNPKYRALFQGRELLGKAYEDALPELTEPFLAWMKDVFATGKPFIGKEIVAHFVRSPNTQPQDIYFDFNFTRVVNCEGKADGIYIHAIDVTETVLARRRLEESEARFRQLADAMPQIVWTARPDGYIDYYNRRWYEFTGAAEGGGDQSWMPILHPEDVEPCHAHWYRSVKTGEPYQFEHRFRNQNSRDYRWHLGRAVPVRDESGTIIRWFGTATDIHGQKMTEGELLRSNAELGRFAFVASHDLKEPLRVIANYVQLLRMQYGGKLDENADRYIDFAVGGVKRMYQLINDVLDFSRIGATPENFKRTELNEILAIVLSNLEASIKESGAEVVSADLPTLVVEQSEILQLLQNLIGNALKYRNRGRKPKIEISAERNQSANWIFCVKDNGIGIESQYLEKIFILFERLHGKENYSGTGIGLAICKKIVERHGGKIWAESEFGKGSSFYFQIPQKLSA